MIPSLSESRSSGRNPFFWAGLAIYTMSYFLIAVNDHELGVHRPGYNCALLALLGPPLLLRVSHPYTDNFLRGLSAILMFFINPAFFLFVAIQFTVQIKLRLSLTRFGCQESPALSSWPKNPRTEVFQPRFR